jgi:hypothetical protein
MRREKYLELRQKSRDDEPLEFIGEGFLVEKHVWIAKLAVETIFDLLDGVDDMLEVRVAGEDYERRVGFAITASLVVEHVGLWDVFRGLRAELVCDISQRSGIAVVLMRETEDVMQTIHGSQLL